MILPSLFQDQLFSAVTTFIYMLIKDDVKNIIIKLLYGCDELVVFDARVLLA
jgi:hypothetical protein